MEFILAIVAIVGGIFLGIISTLCYFDGKCEADPLADKLINGTIWGMCLFFSFTFIIVGIMILCGIR